MRTTIQMLLDDLVSSQRGLTRALVKRDQDARKFELPKRDQAAKAIEEYVGGVTTENRRLAVECHRLGNEVMQIRYVAQLLRESAPLILSEAEARASAVVALPDSTLQSFAGAIEDAVRNGHAKRVRGDVVITYAGLLELARAADMRDKYERIRTECFELGRQLHRLQNPQEAKAS